MTDELKGVYKAIGAIELHLILTCKEDNNYLSDLLFAIQEYVGKTVDKSNA
jgi:hypothetical protein